MALERKTSTKKPEFPVINAIRHCEIMLADPFTTPDLVYHNESNDSGSESADSEFAKPIGYGRPRRRKKVARPRSRSSPVDHKPVSY